MPQKDLRAAGSWVSPTHDHLLCSHQGHLAPSPRRAQRRGGGRRRPPSLGGRSGTFPRGPGIEAARAGGRRRAQQLLLFRRRDLHREGTEGKAAEQPRRSSSSPTARSSTEAASIRCPAGVWGGRATARALALHDDCSRAGMGAWTAVSTCHALRPLCVVRVHLMAAGCPL